MRRWRVGLDWGTSATKMVLRDEQDPRTAQGIAYVIRSADNSVRHPSAVAAHDGRLYFARETEQVRERALRTYWPKLKIDVALQDTEVAFPNLIDGLTALDLSALYLAHLLKFAQSKGAGLPEARQAQVAFQLGIPAADMQKTFLIDRYLFLARMTHHLFKANVDAQRMSIQDVLPSVKVAREHAARLAANDTDQQKVDSGHLERIASMWLRPEVVAEMYWAFHSPKVPIGLYSAVDVGAGTTNVSAFRLHGFNSQKTRIVIHGTACAPPGLNALLEALNPGRTIDQLIQYRGRENDRLSHGATAQALIAADQQIERYRSVQTTAHLAAYRDLPGLRQWDGLQLIMIGGGSLVRRIVNKFTTMKPSNLQGIARFGYLNTSADAPADLRPLPGLPPPKDQELRFLMAAYGLSLAQSQTPDYLLPGNGAPYRPDEHVRAQFDSQELGY